MIRITKILKFLSIFIIVNYTLESRSQSFTKVDGTNFIPTTYNTVDFVDLDSDGDMDIIQTGKSPIGGRVGRIYTNDGLGNYVLLPFNQIQAVLDGDVAFGDLNGNGKVDLIISGSTTQTGSPLTRIYFNSGGSDGTMLFSPSIQLTDFYNSAVAVADVDNDSDLDIMISGWTGTERLTQLYINNGSGQFTLSENNSFTGLSDGTITFSDVDNDGDFDVLITGDTGSGQVTELFINDGTGNFSISSNTFVGVRNGDTQFADLNNNGFEDILLTGWNNNIGERITRLYKNNGSGAFTPHSLNMFTPLSSSDMTIADFNNDGYLDVIICGNSGFGTLTKLYLNDGSGNFIQTISSLTDIGNCSVDAADIDNDGDIDVILSGWADNMGDGTAGKITTLYKNDLISLDIDDEKLYQVSIHPNPTKNQLYLNAGKVTVKVIEIYDLTGRKIISCNGNKTTIDVSSLSSGNYILNLIDSEGRSLVSRFVKSD